jgi:GNAT superfamily N-acetyltransferase
VAERSIRIASVADAPAIARLHLASYRAAYRGLLPERFLAGLEIDQRERRWRDSLRDPARTTFLMEGRRGDASCVLAFAEVGAWRGDGLPPGSGELMALHVAEGAWRQGIGAAMHRRAVDALVAAGCTGAGLWVLRGNRRACAFYEKVGWVPDGDERHRRLRGIDVVELRYRTEFTA